VNNCRLNSFHSPAWRFAVIGTLLCLAVFLLPTGLTEFINLLTARMAANFLALTGVPTHLDGVRLTLGTYAAAVIDECTVMYPGALFIAFLLTTPASWRQRLAGAAVGLSLLNTINVVRIAVVVWLGSLSPVLAKSAHVYFGQVVMVLAVIAACYGSSVRVGQEGSGCCPSSWWVRLTVWSSVLFIPWLFFHRWYVLGNDVLLRAIFAALGRPIALAAELPLYYQTFNTVVFGALLMASRPFLRRTALSYVFAGFIVLWAGHLAVRVANVLFSAFQITQAYSLALVVHVLANYLFPVIVWRLITPAAGPLPRNSSGSRL
jgi:exosortase/archaeosortase family protein